MIDADPDAAKAYFRNAARQVAQGVKKGRQRDPKTGRWMSASQPRTAGHRETADRTADNERLAQLRETVQKRELTEDEYPFYTPTTVLV